MSKESINTKEGISLITTFILGTSLIIGVGTTAGNNAWIAAILGIIMAIPIWLVYIRIISLFPEKDLFDILKITLGKILGSIVGAIYIFYALQLGAIVLRNFGEFIKTVALPETPLLVSILGMGLVVIVAAALGIEVLGRTISLYIPLIIFIMIVVQLLVIPQFQTENLKPLLGNGLMPVVMGGFNAFAFPFAETVLFIGVFSAIKNKKSLYKIFGWGILIATIIIVVVTIRNIGVLGNMLGSFYFPSYAAVSRIKIGDFLQRIEATVSFVFFCGVFVKSSICLLVASRGIEKLFSLKDYRSIVIQTGLLMIYYAYIIFDNSIEMQTWVLHIYAYYAFPMQVIIPIIIWLLAEYKTRTGKLTTQPHTHT